MTHTPEVIDPMISGANHEIHEKAAAEAKRVLIVGIPRCGTTWVSAALAAAPNTILVDEPDDERRWPMAMAAKRHMGRYPVIAPGDTATLGGYSMREYEDLWRRAWERPAFYPCNVIVKTTFVPYCLEWIVDERKIDSVCWVHRHPLNTLASWMEYKRKVHPEEDVAEAAIRMAWQYGMMHHFYSRAESLGLITTKIYHEDLCQDFGAFEHLAKALGLSWNYRAADWLLDMNKAGDGGHWGVPDYQRDEHLNRIAGEQTWERWKERLPEHEVALLMAELERWPSVMQEIHDLSDAMPFAERIARDAIPYQDREARAFDLGLRASQR